MIYIAPVEALDHEMPWKSEVLAYFQGLLVNVLGSEVFSDAAVVSVAELYLVVLVVEEIVHVHIVHIALDTAQVDVVCLLLIALFLLAV